LKAAVGSGNGEAYIYHVSVQLTVSCILPQHVMMMHSLNHLRPAAVDALSLEWLHAHPQTILTKVA